MTISVWDLRGVEDFELEDKPSDFALPPSMELDGQGNLLSEEHDSGPTKLLSKPHYGWGTVCKRYFSMLISNLLSDVYIGRLSLQIIWK